MKAVKCLIALTGVALLALCQPALAVYPEKPIRIVVPFAAGGALDTIARTLGKRMSEQMNTPFVIENKPGAGGNLGTDLVAKAAPDGYTLLLAANGLASNPSLYKNLSYDPLRDLAPIALVAYAPMVLAVPYASPAKSLRDVIAAGRAKPSGLTYGSAGSGTSGHLATELFKVSAKIDAIHVPYKGGAPALTDLMGGRLSFMLLNPVELAPHIKSQRLRALAVASDKRLATMPDVQTFAEAGLPGFEARNWWALMMPAKTPKEITSRLSDEVLKAVADTSVGERLADMGAIVEPLSAERFGKYLQEETAKWAEVIKTVGISAE